MTTIADLADKRQELDLSMADAASRLSEHHDLAESTLSTRISQWERGERDPTDEDLDALQESLDAIEEERNFEYPECSREGCGYVSQIDVEYHNGEVLCLACYDYLEERGEL